MCSGTGVSIREIADLLLAQAKRPIRLVTDPALVRAVDVPAWSGATRASARHRLDTRDPVETLADVLEAARAAL